MSRGKNHEIPICTICGKPIYDKQPHAKYHDGECANAAERRRYRNKKYYEKQRVAARAKWKFVRKCSECGKDFMPKTPKQATCGDKACFKARKRRMEVLRVQGIYQRDARENVFGEYPMPDPWPTLDTLPLGQVSWYSAQMMPGL